MSTVMVRAGIRGQGRERLARALAAKAPFTTSGALRGLSRPEGAGRLLGPDRELFFDDAAAMTFVVYSYATPIYWETPDHAHHVEGSFTQTTMRHKAVIRSLLT